MRIACACTRVRIVFCCHAILFAFAVVPCAGGSPDHRGREPGRVRLDAPSPRAGRGEEQPVPHAHGVGTLAGRQDRRGGLRCMGLASLPECGAACPGDGTANERVPARGAAPRRADHPCAERLHAAYEGHPARRRAQEAPRAANLPADIGQWCHQIPAEEQGVYPIDQSDGGEDDDPQEHAQWESQLKAEGATPMRPGRSRSMSCRSATRMRSATAARKSGTFLEQRGIQHVMVLGVHTNMCVLGRPFGLRQLAKNGKRVVLVRDLTDTMYNPQRSPFVQHHSGTDLIVEHIEKYVCPTITSDQLLGGKPFRFSTDRRKHVAIVMSEDEYKTEQTLTQFAREYLQRDFRLSFFYADAHDMHLLPGIEQLAEADVALISVRRRALPKPQLDVFRKFVADGKPIVAIRTASHAFALRDGQPPAGHDVWPEFDRDVLGGNYQGHHDNQPGAGPPTRVWILPEARGAGRAPGPAGR